MRQIVLDTETTGLELSAGHRVIEIGCIELLHRRPSGRSWHRYIRPGREVDPAALAVHGITNEFLATQPSFPEVAGEFLAFIDGAELVIHNAEFDVSFLDAELGAAGIERHVAERCRVCDTLAMARRMHPGQRNSLDALAKRYEIDNSHRELHGALLDARILADVYLAMTGGQGALALTEAAGPARMTDGARPAQALVRTGLTLPVLRATDEESRAHESMLALIARASGGNCLWPLADAALPAVGAQYSSA